MEAATAPYKAYRQACVDKLGVTLPAPLYVADLPYPYTRGVLAARDIPAHTTLLTVPQAALITCACAVDMPHLRAFFARLRLPSMLEDDTLALTLLYERHALREKSRWAAYLAALPAAYDLPFYWSGAEVDALAGTGLHAIAARLQAQLAEDFAALRAALDGAAAAARGGSAAEAAGFAALSAAFTLDAYRWAISTVWSRGVSLRMGGGALVKVLAPFFDMLNTSPAARVRHGYDAKRRALTVITDQPWAAGQQVCLNYGHRSSRTLIQLHGFVLPGCAAERYQLEMRFSGGGGEGGGAAEKLALHRLRPPSDEPGTPREEQGVVADLGGGALYANFQLWEGVYSDALLRFLRIQMAPPELLPELGAALRGNPNGQCSVELEAEVLQLLCKSLVDILGALKEGGEEARDATALADIVRDAEVGARSMARMTNALRAEMGLRPLPAAAAAEGGGGGGEGGGGEGEGEGEEDASLPSLTAGRSGGGGGGKGKGPKAAAASTASALAAAAEADKAADAALLEHERAEAAAEPPLSRAAEDAGVRRLQLAAYLRHRERRILETQLLMMEKAMDELRGVVEEFYKEGGQGAAGGGEGGEGGGEGGGGGGGGGSEEQAAAGAELQ